ncbi:hypothetical protein [Sanguibacter sp. HDW7]|uniref:hypothetical protein n=1 Tax=Sanguibacter sp. HDW7 TaxID=2714931 RepID=UPI0014075D38|nr:hypothetical protein [Sanguibacter sp. HDW7]QIK83531.1 hypothetical protein G7063_07745 [Sanguibacter sp. HDW7]
MFIVASFVVVGAAAPPASAAPVASALKPPSWLPIKSALPSSAVSREYYYATRLGAVDLAEQQTQAQVKKLLSQMNVRGAADKGVYIEGMTEMMKSRGVSAFDISDADMYDWYRDSYSKKPGATSALAPASVAKSGVVTVTDSRGLSKVTSPGGTAKNVFMKVGNAAAVGAAVVGTAEIGVAVGTGIAGLVGLPTTGSFMCDVATAFADSDCGLAGVEGYVPNQDLGEGVPAGFPNGNTRTVVANDPGTYRPESFTVRVDPLPPVVPEFQAQGAVEMDFLWSIGGFECSPNYGTVSTQNGAKGTRSDGQEVDFGGYTSFSGSLQCNGVHQGRVERDVTGSGTYKFDHWVWRNTSTAWTMDPIIWVPEGHKDWTPGVEGNARRHWLTEWTCTQGPGGQAQSVWYREADDRIPGAPQASCAFGQVQTLTVSQVTEGVGTEVVYEWSLPQETEDFFQNYPECADGTCLLDLKVKKTGTEVSCFLSPELCVDWTKDPDRETNYQCYYGSKKVPLTECYLYGPTFNRDLGVPYGDPVTGDVPDPELEEQPDDGSAPGPGGSPGVEDFDPNCPPKFTAGGLFSGWWVYKGTSCALKEVFVPDKANIATQVSKVKTTLDTKPPFTLVAPATATINGFKTGWDGGCSQPLAEFDPWKQGRLTIPCTPPQSAPLTALYGVAVAGIVGATVFGVWHMLTAAIGGRDAGTGD